MARSETEKFAELRAEVHSIHKSIGFISNSEVFSDGEKTIMLLALIAEQVAESNFLLEMIKDELFQHTMALDDLNGK